MQDQANRKELPVAKKIAFSGVIVLFLLLLSEGILRLAGFSFSITPPEEKAPEVWASLALQSDPTLFWSWIPVPGGRCHDKHGFNFNREGYRGAVAAPTKAPGTLRIVCLGDSVSMGWRVGDNETFCRLLQQELAAELHRQVETINLGVGGYSSFQGVHYMKTRVLPLHPDIVTVEFGWNDHMPALTQELTYGVKPTSSIRAIPDGDLPPERPVTLQTRLSHIRLFQLVQWAVSRAQGGGLRKKTSAPPAVAAEKAAPVVENSPTRIARVSVEEYKQNIREIVRIARSNGITPILMTEPVTSENLRGNFVKDIAFNYELHAGYNTAMREVAASERAVLVDLAPVFSGRTGLFFDIVHPRPEGHRLISSALAAAVVQQSRIGTR